MTTTESLVFTASRQPPPKPPDGIGNDDGKTSTPLSFRDKLLGNKKASQPKERTDLIQQGLVKVDYVDGNRLLPRLHIDENMFEGLCEPWREALIIKLLGKNVGFKIMQSKLPGLWKLAGGFDLMDVDNGFYMVKFDLAEDREKVIGGGPWMFFDHYLAVSTWSPDFVSSSAKIEKTMVWIRFPGMNLLYYDESILLAMASVVGKPIKVDQRTLSVERGRFARVCVEIDLNQPVVAQIWVRGAWHKVSYEGLHILCSSCGCYGHLSRNCSTPATTPATATVMHDGSNGVNDEPSQSQPGSEFQVTTNQEFPKPAEMHGDWMMVAKKKSHNRGGPHKNGIVQKNGNINGNKFIPLMGASQEGKKSADKRNPKKDSNVDKSMVGGNQATPKEWIRKRQRTTNASSSQKAGGKHSTNDVVGGPKIYDLGIEEKSTLNLVHETGNRYELFTDNEDMQMQLSLSHQHASRGGLGGPGGLS